MLRRTHWVAFASAMLVLLAAVRVASAAIISVGPYTPSTTMPFVVPIEITGAVDLIFWQFDVFYDASDVQIVTNCDPFSDPFCNFGGTGVTEGPFFGSLSPFNLFNPGFILLDSVTLAQLGQLIAVNDTFGGSLPGPSGDGVLAYIEFVTTATGTGTSPITVQNASTTSAVPEPATLALLVGGVALLGVRRRMNSRRAMSANGASRIACAVAVALGLGACDRSASDQSSSATPPKAAAAKHAIARQVPTATAKASMTPMTQPAESDRASPPWLAELLSSPDFQVRLQGLEAWAQHPGTTLDAVTYALVDPEESVRARAQEVFEEELARR